MVKNRLIVRLSRLWTIFTKYKKILSYLSIPIISLFLFYLIIKVFVILVPFLKSASVLIVSLILVSYAYWGIPFLLKRLELHPRDDCIKLLYVPGFKIKYYTFVMKFLKLWNISAVILIITILAFMLVLIINQFISNPITIPKNLKSISENLSLTILFTVYMLANSLVFLGIVYFSWIFPQNKGTGLPDVSDIPTSFLEKANEEISLFDFSSTWENKQQNKNKISNLMNNANEFITTRDKILGVPHGLRYYQLFIGGLENRSSNIDIINRINGFSEKLNKIIVDLNYMNTVEDKEEIYNSIIEYLDILKNRNLHKMEKVDFPRIGFIETTIKRIEPLKNLIVIIVVIFLGLESIKKILGL